MVDEWGLLPGGFLPLERGLWRQVEVVFGACPTNWTPGSMRLLLLAVPPVAARSCMPGGSRGFLHGPGTASVSSYVPHSPGFGQFEPRRCPKQYVSVYGGCDGTVTHPGPLCPLQPSLPHNMGLTHRRAFPKSYDSDCQQRLDFVDLVGEFDWERGCRHFVFLKKSWL